jgi:prevent-host-death family protein
VKEIMISEDIVPIGTFKTQISKFLRRVRETGSALVITQNGKASGVLISAEEYDALRYARRFRASVLRGVEESDAGATHSTEEVRKELKRRREA